MSSPFGIALGSTPSSIEAKYIVAFNQVSKPHPKFPNVSGLWSPETGLYEIIARSETYYNDPYGLAVTLDYDQVKSQLQNNYGPCFEMETLREGALYDEARDFIESIARNDRMHGSRWARENASQLPESIAEITLIIDAVSECDAQLVINYSYVKTPVGVQDEMAEAL